MAILTERDLEVLNELRSSSAGLVKRLNSTAVRRDSRALVVGLGGRGVDTVCELKKELKKRIGEIDSNYMRFLAIDTATFELNDKEDAGELTKSEFVNMTSVVLDSLANASENYIPETITKIKPDKFNPRLDGQGANQIRLSGRISVMDPTCFMDLQSKIKQAISGMGQFANEKLEVYVIAGIGGGSGSGLVIDVPYIIRHVFTNDLGLKSDRMNIFGYIYLPNIYKGRIPNYDQAEANGYAALKEIDYYMNIREIRETFDADYPGKISVSSHDNIFNVCTLIGGNLAADIVVQDPLEYARTVCVENIINQVTKVVINDQSAENGKTMSDYFTSKSFDSNKARAFDTVIAREPESKLPRNANYKYAIIGAATLKFPDLPITEYIVSNVYASMEDLLKENAEKITKEDVDAFENAVGLSFVSISKPFIDSFNRKFNTRVEDANLSKKAIEDGSNDLLTMLDADINSIVNSMPSKEEFFAACEAKAMDAAAAIYKDAAKGPYFLEKLLYAHTSQGASVQGYFQRIDNYGNVANKAMDALKTSSIEYDQARKKKEDNVPLIVSGRWKDAYLENIKEVYVYRLNSMIAEKLASYYGAITRQTGLVYDIKCSIEENIVHFIDLIRGTANVMRSNIDYNYRPIFSDDEKDMANSIFIIDEPEIRDLKFAVRDRVQEKLASFKKENVSFFASALLENIITNRENWRIKATADGRSASSCNALRDFIKGYSAFEDIINNTFAGYFDYAYSTKTQQYKDKVANIIIGYLELNSRPSVNVWDSFDYKSVPELNWTFMVLPSSMDENNTSGEANWLSRFNNDLGNRNLGNKNIMISPEPDAMYYYTMYVCMPLYLHKDLMEYEQKYRNCAHLFGMHINENENGGIAMKDFPALFIREAWDRSQRGGLMYDNDVETKYFDALTADFNKAVEYGVARKTGTSNDLYCFCFANVTFDDGGKVALDKFVNDYIKKHAATPADYQNGSLIYQELCDTFGVSEDAIPAAGQNHLVADTEANAVRLVRKAMRLTKKFRDYLTAVEKAVFAPIKNAGGVIIAGENRSKFINFLLYNIIIKKDGAWLYKRGGDQQITSKLQINADAKLKVYSQKLSIEHERTGDTIVVPDLMEYVAYKKFIEAENSNETFDFLNRKLSEVSSSLTADEAVAVKVSVDTYSAKANTVTQIYELKMAQFGFNSPEDLGADYEVYTFYKELKSNCDTLLEAFE